jgi:hypothetical protein
MDALLSSGTFLKLDEAVAAGKLSHDRCVGVAHPRPPPARASVLAPSLLDPLRRRSADALKAKYAELHRTAGVLADAVRDAVSSRAAAQHGLREEGLALERAQRRKIDLEAAVERADEERQTVSPARPVSCPTSAPR